MMHAMTSGPAILAFVLGGRAVFTVRSPSGCRFTYRVVSDERATGRFFVSVLAGPDNTRSYQYVGTIFDSRTFRLTRKSRVAADARSVVAFSWMWERMVAGRDIAPASFYHSGKCARCHLPLTTPSSLESGFGPTCITKADVPT